MATLNDSFLADLDALSDNEADFPEEEDGSGNMEDSEAFHNFSTLQKTQRYNDTIQRVEGALQNYKSTNAEHQLIVECLDALYVEIENEITIIHNFIRDKYRLKLPELESLVHHPIDYARVVKKIGNETDLTLVDLEGLLPSAIVMVLSVIASSTSGKPLREDVLEKTMEACDRALELDSAKKKAVDFIESRMLYIAPNLSAVVGSAVAAKLMVTSGGGLLSLAKMPACNVLLLGAKKNPNSAGFSTAASSRLFHVGYIGETEIVESTPPALRMRACRLVASKASLAARVDSTRGSDPDPDPMRGKAGRDLREEILKKIDKWQEAPPPKLPKPLPVPADHSEPARKKRGGCHLRKRKQRYNGVTDNNRMQFGVPEEEEETCFGFGFGYGMLVDGLAARVAKKFKESKYGASACGASASSLAFTPVQGIELSNPHPQLGSATQSSTYFSETATFSKIKIPPTQ